MFCFFGALPIDQSKIKPTGCLKKNFLLSKLAMANITVDNEKSTIIFHDKCR